jgi:hypothetical protein
MPLPESRERHATMLQRLMDWDIDTWAEDYVSALVESHSRHGGRRHPLVVRRAERAKIFRDARIVPNLTRDEPASPSKRAKMSCRALDRGLLTMVRSYQGLASIWSDTAAVDTALPRLAGRHPRRSPSIAQHRRRALSMKRGSTRARLRKRPMSNSSAAGTRPSPRTGSRSSLALAIATSSAAELAHSSIDHAWAGVPAGRLLRSAHDPVSGTTADRSGCCEVSPIR